MNHPHLMPRPVLCPLSEPHLPGMSLSLLCQPRDPSLTDIQPPSTPIQQCPDATTAPGSPVAQGNPGQEPADALTILRSGNRSGFRYVNRTPSRRGYEVRLKRDGQKHYLGKFATREEGAISVAQWLHRRSRIPGNERPRPMTATEAIATAAARGLILVRANNDTGYMNVVYNDRISKYQATPWLNGKKRSVGFFHTPEEAALRVAQTPGDHDVCAERE